jgi:Leucine-rich repeat (LRR) protein
MSKLTIEYILERCKVDSLQKIRKLDVFSGDIEDVSIVEEIPMLEVCSLSLNNITSLKSFAYCQHLQELFLRKNNISDLLEVKHLRNCVRLKVLWLQDNPISKHPLYR